MLATQNLIRLTRVSRQNLVRSTAKCIRIPSVSVFPMDKISTTTDPCSIPGASWRIEHGQPPIDRFRSGRDFGIAPAWYVKHGLRLKMDHIFAEWALFPRIGDTDGAIKQARFGRCGRRDDSGIGALERAVVVDFQVALVACLGEPTAKNRTTGSPTTNSRPSTALQMIDIPSTSAARGQTLEALGDGSCEAPRRKQWAVFDDEQELCFSPVYVEGGSGNSPPSTSAG